jgi:hypothetical protein
MRRIGAAIIFAQQLERWGSKFKVSHRSPTRLFVTEREPTLDWRSHYATKINADPKSVHSQMKPMGNISRT